MLDLDLDLNGDSELDTRIWRGKRTQAEETTSSAEATQRAIQRTKLSQYSTILYIVVYYNMCVCDVR